jgi:putative spermidine/putrescine transport system ATP-binding protein
MTQSGEIRLQRVTKRFGPTVAVKDIDLTIPQGSYCCLLGPSGCGKTTILRMIAGHEEPSEGRVLIGGDDVTGLPPVRRGTAMMFQSYALFPHMTVVDNVAYNLRMRGVGKAERRRQARAMLARVHLDAFAERMPAQLSGGQQQRVALARALITNPRVLLLDEPLSALDEFLRLQMRGELKRLQRELGITFIHVTHTQLEAIALADLVVVMDQGRIEQAGAAQTIYNEPQSAYVARFMGGQNVLSGKVTAVAEGEATLASTKGDRFALPFRGTAELAGTLVHCAVRRDRIQLERVASTARSGQVNALTGEVHAIEYQGSYVKVTLDVPGWPDFVANVSDDRFFAMPVDIGDPVLARWSAKDVRLLEADLGRAPEDAGEIGLYNQELGLAQA